MKKIIKKMSGRGYLPRLDSLKKVLSIVLILTILIIPFSTVLNTKAEGFNFILSDTVTKSDDVNSKLITNTATITVTNFEYVSNGGYIKATKIINAFYNQNTNEVSYEFTEAFQTFLNSNETYKTLTIADYFALTSDNPDGSASTSVITTSTLNKLLSDYLISQPSYEYNFKGVSTDEVCNGTDCPGTASGTVEAGVYALQGYQTISMYGVMTANVVPTVDENGNWTINNPTIVAKKSNHLERGTLTVAQKKVSIKDNLMTANVKYSGKIPAVPTNMKNDHYYYMLSLYNGSVNSMKITDSNSVTTELTIKDDGTVYMGDLLVATITDNISIHGKNIQFSSDNRLANMIIDIDYTFSTGDLNTGSTANSIRIGRAWPSDSYNTNVWQGYDIVDDLFYVYLINIMTKDKSSEAIGLQGAEYELYRNYDSQTNTLSDKVDDSDYMTQNENNLTIVFEEGIYYAKQIKAPSGYKLSKDIIKIDVSMNSENQPEEDGPYMATCYNEKSLFSLPSTGGLGTILYTTFGLLIIAMGSIGFISYRKRRVNG